MIEFVFQCDDDHGVVGHCLFHRDIDAEEKGNNNKAHNNNRHDLVFFPHPKGFQLI
jgi:hypothetical protein